VTAPHSTHHTRARRAFFTTLWLLALATPIVLAAARGEQRKAATSPPIRAEASIKQLMAGLIDPAADTVWESVGTIISAAGTEERRPKTDKEWEAVRNAALHLTEGGNLLMLGHRAKDHDAWWRMSRTLVDAGAVALKAAEDRNVQALFDAGEGIATACDTCHGVYWIYQEGEDKKEKPGNAARLEGRGAALLQLRELRE
jgi:cytochrome c553